MCLSLTGQVKKSKIKYLVVFFLSIVALIYTMDSLVSLYIKSGQKQITLAHFSWYFQPLFSRDSFARFLDQVIKNKEGLLGEKWFYVLAVGFFIFAGIWLLLSIYKENNSSFQEGHPTNSGNWPINGKGRFLRILIFWVIVKQILFLVVLPPWQGPDETASYLKIGFLTKDYVELEGELVASCESFDFVNLAERGIPHLPNTGWKAEQFESSQPDLYYLITDSLGRAFQITELPYIVYVGRFVSSLCILVTVIFVYLISLQVFTGKMRGQLAQLSLFFVSAHPQLSFVGATFSSDAMAIMFVTGTLFFLMLTVKNRSIYSPKCFVFPLIAVGFAILAISSKTTGLAIIPVSILVFSRLLYIKLILEKKTVTPYLLIALSCFLLFIGLWEYDFLGLRSFTQNRLFSSIISAMGTFSIQIDSESLRNLIIYFMSFWLSYGWMVYKMSIGTYLFLGMLSGLVLIGLAANYKKKLFRTDKMAYFLLLLNAGVVLSMCYAHSDPQGRFLFTSISFFSIVFAKGIFTVIPEKNRVLGCEMVSGSLVLFNLFTVFGLLIPVFYLR